MVSKSYTAGVLALLASAEHVISDTGRGHVAVGGGALAVGPDLHGQLLENRRLRSLLL